jgi:hypothetical protein
LLAETFQGPDWIQFPAAQMAQYAQSPMMAAPMQYGYQQQQPMMMEQQPMQYMQQQPMMMEQPQYVQV